MAARMLSKSLLRCSSSVFRHRSTFFRHFSSSNENAEFFEIDLESTASSPASVINKMEEIIHGIIVKKATPDWLPFLPGSSFWVPLPRHSSKRVSHLVQQLTNQLTPNEYLSLTTGRGWPCVSFFAPDGEKASVGQDVMLKFSEEDGEELRVEVSIDSGDESS